MSQIQNKPFIVKSLNFDNSSNEKFKITFEESEKVICFSIDHNIIYFINYYGNIKNYDNLPKKLLNDEDFLKKLAEAIDQNRENGNFRVSFSLTEIIKDLDKNNLTGTNFHEYCKKIILNLYPSFFNYGDQKFYFEYFDKINPDNFNKCLNPYVESHKEEYDFLKKEKEIIEIVHKCIVEYAKLHFKTYLINFIK